MSKVSLLFACAISTVISQIYCATMLEKLQEIKDYGKAKYFGKEAATVTFFGEERLRGLIAGGLPYVVPRIRPIPLIGDVSPFDTIAVHPKDAPWYMNPEHDKKVTVKFGGQKFKSNEEAELEPVYATSNDKVNSQAIEAAALTHLSGQ